MSSARQTGRVSEGGGAQAAQVRLVNRAFRGLELAGCWLLVVAGLAPFLSWVLARG